MQLCDDEQPKGVASGAFTRALCDNVYAQQAPATVTDRKSQSFSGAMWPTWIMLGLWLHYKGAILIHDLLHVAHDKLVEGVQLLAYQALLIKEG